MGLISKIEDKLTGSHHDPSHHDSSKAQQESQHFERHGREHETRQGTQGGLDGIGDGAGSSSGGTSSSAQYGLPGQHGASLGLKGTTAKHKLQQGDRHSGTDGVVGQADSAALEHRSTSGGTSNTTHSSVPNQYSSGGVQSSISGQHPSTSGAQSSLPGQFSSNSSAQSSTPSQYSGTGSSSAHDSISSSRDTLRHQIGNVTGNSGSGTTGGSAITGAGLAEVGTAGSQASHGAYDSSAYGRENPSVSSTSDRLHNTHLGSTRTSNLTGTLSSDHATPRQPYDPYSSKGQQIAANAAESQGGYGASQGRAEVGETGSRSSVPTEVKRTSGGGISNGMTGGLHGDSHTHPENRDAIKTTGGQRLGTGAVIGSVPGAFDSYDNAHGHSQTAPSSQGQSGYTSHGQETNTYTGPASNTIGPHSSNIANVLDPRVQPDPALQSSVNHQQRGGRDDALAGSAGAGDTAAYGSHEKHHDKYDSQHTSGHHRQKDLASHPQSGYTGLDGTRSSYKQPSTYHAGDQRHHHHHQGTIDSQSQRGLADTDTTHDAHKTSSAHHGTTTDTAPYGQNVSYLNRAPAEGPLSQEKNFAERYPAVTGVGASTVGAGALAAEEHHYQSASQHGTHSGVYDNDGRSSQHHNTGSGLSSHTSGANNGNIPSQISGASRSTNPSQAGTTSRGIPTQSSTTGSASPFHTSSTAGSTGLPSATNSTASGGAGASKSQEGLSIARRLGQAYEAGYRDALEHMRQEREGY